MDKKWTVEYDNDTGIGDEGFYQWWEITDGDKTFTCNDGKDAEWLCYILNNLNP